MSDSVNETIPGLVVRGRQAVDWPAVWQLCNRQPPHLNPLEIPYRAADAAQATFGGAPDNLSTFGLVAEQGGQLLGEITFRQFTRERRRHIAIIERLVLKDADARPIGTALINAALDLGENWLHVTRFETILPIDALPLIDLVQGCGFVVEGTLRDYAFRAGRYVDARLLARLAVDQPRTEEHR